ncbi:hypothetical protein BH11CYA1_BH11CYA1_43600 [soil metagenome]
MLLFRSDLREEFASIKFTNHQKYLPGFRTTGSGITGEG